MLYSTNKEQFKMNLDPLKIVLELDNIPIYDGVIDLLNKGFESSLAPSNEIFLKHIDGDKSVRFELKSDNFFSNESFYKAILRVLIDPQTCGPLVVSCSPIYSEQLISKGPWMKIGYVY